jgi:hypothetical protein
VLELDAPICAANDDAMLQRLAFCIAAATTCAQTCSCCTDAALSAPDVDALRECIRTADDCAELCSLTARLLMRGSGRDRAVIRDVVRACLTACRVCRRECERQAAVLQFCSACATACGVCEQSCAELAPILH